VNDTYGHAVGDEYLKKFVNAAVDTIGENGNIYRMSGDEFICLYKNHEKDEFVSSFTKNIESFLEMDIPFLGVSIGYAYYKRDGVTMESLIKKADTIMYEVKKRTKDDLCYDR
jgi:diguanylate cyclase (GGDEF)-like protein